MKQTIRLVLGLGFLGAILGSAVAFAHGDGKTNAGAAELAVHRVDRLVDLNKIDASFQSNAQNMKVETIAHQHDDEPSFKVTLYQAPGADGSQKGVEIVLNENGKALSFRQIAGSDAVNVPAWGSLTATTLIENSLHYVLNNAEKKPELMPFFENMSSLKLSPGTNSSGTSVAVVEIKATANDGVLRIKLKLDGSFDSAEVAAKIE